MSSPATDGSSFARLAPSYDRLRPADERWWALTEALVRAADLRGRRVLDVGCGTGRLLAALAERHAVKAWGIDASPEMVEVARAALPATAGVRVGRAEALPFRDGWFERVVMRMVVHHLDRPAAFAEARRVLGEGGTLGIVTEDPAFFDRHWLARWFPELVRIDAERFPSAETLERELAAAGLAPRVERLRLPARVPRDEALERIRGRAYSTFDLLSDEEYAEGLARAEAELPDPLAYELDWLVVSAGTRPA